MRGRRPKPIEQRQREGGSDVSHRPLPQPMLVAGRPLSGELEVPPDHLPKLAREFWSKTVSYLIEVGVVDRIDEAALEMLSVQYARWRQAQAVVAVDGHFTRGAAGQLREHPAVKIEREAHALFLKTAEHFALTPIARSRLGLAELHGRALHAEIEGILSPTVPVNNEPVIEDVEVVDDDIGLPGG